MGTLSQLALRRVRTVAKGEGASMKSDVIAEALACLEAWAGWGVDAVWIDEYRNCRYGWCSACGAAIDAVSDPSNVEHDVDCLVLRSQAAIKAVRDARHATREEL